MSSEVEEEERRALIGHDLDSSTLIVHQNEDTISICHLPQSNHTDTPSLSLPNQRQRLSSLDVFRGLTVALMILVDNVGRAFPSLNHSPWFGVTLADFVMPFFLFVVGVSIGLVFQKVSSKSNTTKKVILRTLKLFLLGLLLQGGYFHGRGKLTYGVDLSKIRWLGILQRISIGYFLASISEIWLVNHNILVDSPAGFVKKYSIQWMFSILLCSVYLCLLYGLYVPNWKFKHSNLLWSSDSSHLSIIQNVHCEVRGSLEPPCNVVGFIDRLILGEDHMYQRPVYIRTKECSVNSPDYGPLPPDSPGWCLAPFDPEGILSSLMAAITCFMGLQYGHIIVHLQGHKQRVLLWSVFSFSLLLIGYILEILGMPLSKALYTLSYTCITAGASGLVLTAIYYIVDIEHLRKPTVLLQWMGMNALVAYALAACDIFPAVIQGFYWHSPENNLVDASEALMQIIFHSKRNLSRHQLGDLQSKMFPDYFLMLGVCCAVSVTSFDYLHPWKTSSTTERFQLGFLFSSFTFNLANLFVFAPMIIEMMKQRHKMEKENNIGEEELWSNNVEVAAMNKKFRMIHGLSSRASIMSIGCLAIHSCYLAGKIGL